MAGLLGGRVCTDASGSVLRLREGAEATTPALTEPSALVTDGGAPAEGGSRKGADLALAPDPAPSECLSEARYRSLRHAAVSFGSSDISAFYFTRVTVNILVTDRRPASTSQYRPICTQSAHHHFAPPSRAARSRRPLAPSTRAARSRCPLAPPSRAARLREARRSTGTAPFW